MATIPNSSAFPTAVFLGDSITTGWQAISHPRNRWSSLVCEHLGWREVNLALDGMGFFVRRGGRLPGGRRGPSNNDNTWLETALRSEPDVLTICLGINDSGLIPASQELIRQAIIHDLDFFLMQLRAVNPEVQIVVAPYFPALGAGPNFQAINSMIHEESTLRGIYSTDAMSEAIDGDTEKLAIDGIHPNDAGHAAIARAMIKVYESILSELAVIK